MMRSLFLLWVKSCKSPGIPTQGNSVFVLRVDKPLGVPGSQAQTRLHLSTISGGDLEANRREPPDQTVQELSRAPLLSTIGLLAKQRRIAHSCYSHPDNSFSSLHRGPSG
jgi:hypothetical protein